MISYLGSISATSCTFKAGVTNESNNQVVIVEDSSTTLRKYSLSTLAQVGVSVTTVTVPSGVALINSSSAVVTSSSSSSFDFIDLTSNARTNITSMESTPSSSIPSTQFIASDLSLQVAF